MLKLIKMRANSVKGRALRWDICMKMNIKEVAEEFALNPLE